MQLYCWATVFTGANQYSLWNMLWSYFLENTFFFHTGMQEPQEAILSFFFFFLMAWLTVYLPIITPQGYINSIIMYSTEILTAFGIHMGPVQWWHASDCLWWEGSEKYFLCLCETDIIQSMGSSSKKITQLSTSVQSVGVWGSHQVETKQDRT